MNFKLCLVCQVDGELKSVRFDGEASSLHTALDLVAEWLGEQNVGAEWRHQHYVPADPPAVVCMAGWMRKREAARIDARAAGAAKGR